MLNGNSVMDQAIPLAFHLSQNYPNPFKEETVIKYCVAYTTRVKLTVYDSEGEVIETLVDEEKKPGTYEIKFTACVGHSGESRILPKGMYSYRLEAGNYASLKNMILEK
jgi:hypothetical protein